jgi:DNA-binding NarL/FixJ family response regulator
MKKLRVMIVSHPGTWQRVLQKNLEAYPFVDAVDVVTGSLSASQLAKENSPSLILIDSSIPIDDAIALVQIVKRENTNTNSVVITDTTQQRRKVIRAGADYTISSFNYESQIGEILNNLIEPLPDEPNKSETNITTNPHSSK